MDVDSEVEPTLQEMAKRIAVMKNDLLPALRQLDEDTILSFYSVDEQARLYLSAAFTLALSLYSLDKITHRQVTHVSTGAAGSRLTGAGTRSGSANHNTGAVPSNTDTQLVLKIERITEYIKKLQELATLERNKKLAATAAAAAEAEKTPSAEAEEEEKVEKKASAAGKKRARDASAVTRDDSSSASTAAKKAKADTSATTAEKSEEAADDEYGDAQMFSVVSRVAGETGTLVGRLLKQVMTAKPEQ